MRRALLVFLVSVAGCSREASSPASSTARVEASASAAPVVVTVNDASAPAPVVEATGACAVPSEVDTIDDGEGVPGNEGQQDLEDVQLVADETTTAVAWARQTNYIHGDSWRTPMFAIKKGPTWDRVELPVLAYACALYGVSATNTPARPFVSWGVANNNSFEVFDQLPKLLNPKDFVSPHSKPISEVRTTKQTVMHSVASRDISFSVLSEDLCEPSCSCGDGTNKGRISFWLRGLDEKRPFAKRVSTIYEWTDKAGAPALALGDAAGIVAYRAKSKLFLAWLDADGKPTTDDAAIEFDSGDVGAPAVAMMGREALVVWARRTSKDEPYVLQSMRLATGSAPSTPMPIKTAGSAFAPALLADAKSLTIAWMEGDSGKRGEIHMARTLSSPGGGIVPSIVVSGTETNARDPELSGTPTHPAIVWQSFPKERLAGVIKVARTNCQ